MAIIIEDGSIVDGANSFVTVAEVKTYCELRELDLLVDGVAAEDAQIETFIIKATDYIHSLESRFQGARYSPENQELCFPRDGAYLWGVDITGTIPKPIKEAVSRLAYDVSQQELLLNINASANGPVVKKKVGPLETEFAEPSANTSRQPILANAMAILEPLLKSGSYGFGINIDCSR